MVIAIKRIKADLPGGFGMYLHNFKDGQEIALSVEEEKGINTWVPGQNEGKQIRIQIINVGNNSHVDAEFYLWDDYYKLQCSYPSGEIKTILTVSGSTDIGITVSLTGVQAHVM